MNQDLPSDSAKIALVKEDKITAAQFILDRFGEESLFGAQAIVVLTTLDDNKDSAYSLFRDVISKDKETAQVRILPSSINYGSEQVSAEFTEVSMNYRSFDRQEAYALY